jgi:hypothetical protein
MMPDHYFGKYLGIVKDNQDDQNLGRVKVLVPSIFSEADLMVAMPALPYGYFFVPEVNARVWVEFEGGDPGLPIWTGLQYISGEWASEANANPPELRVIKTKAGHLLIFDDKPGEESIHIKDGVNSHEINLTQSGIQVKDGVNSHEITLDDQGIQIKDGVNNQSVKLNGSGIELDDDNQNSLKMTSSGATLSISSGAKVDLSSSAITIDTGQGAKITISAGIVTLECAGAVQVKGNPVMLSSSAALPVARISDFGVGNLGAPVVITAVGNPMVLA